MRVLGFVGGMATGVVLTLITGVALWVHDTAPLRPRVEVRVENHTGQDVQEVRLEHANGEVVHRLLLKGESLALSYVSRGDSSYKLIAILEDGRRLTGGAGYIEGGARTREVLEPERVVSSDP
ncbi:hypothetical protein OV208_38165 [Corallococcus sp. bb12-1]|uniref:hypothetical protein n=1 Tax=Corallococcus sp. bb12-1 TaxID=2996784 RepID=UPI0022716988|nr:hypothetical protein [Corallococcus sp. bb12-1]MCY1047191.1 hypothetical protein [Corallococcus sp. bb12-1]